MALLDAVSPALSLITVVALSIAGCALEERAPGVGGDYHALPFQQAAAGPCEEGAIRSCSIELSRNGDIVSCFSGTQICRDGFFAACGATDGGTLESKHLPPASDLQTKSLSVAGEGKGICATNPCDITCRGFDERPAIAYSTTPVVSSWYENVVGFGGSPPGFISKLVREPCSAPVDCGYDLHCDFTTRKCVRNEPGWTYAPASCGMANVTVGAACDVGGRVTLPVCNRGNVAIPAGRVIKLAIKNGDWISQPNCPMVKDLAVNCSHTLASPLFPGACVTIDTCGYGGNAVAFVNADFAISECPGNGMTLGCSDNWSDVKVVPCVKQTLTSYLPVTFSETYTASCPISTRPAWQLLTYSGSTPANLSGQSAIKFSVQTAPLLSTGLPGTYRPVTTAADTALGDPGVCSATTTSCPKNLYASLGGDPAAHDPALKLTITLTPTPDALLPATLQSWQVSYSCVPTE